MSHVPLFAPLWTATRQASLALTISQSLPKFMSIASSHPAISSSDAFFCPQSFLASDIYPMSPLFTSDKQNTGASAIINSSSNKYLELIFFKIDWFHLLAMQGTLRSLLQYQSLKASILWCFAFFMVQLSQPYMTPGEDHSLDCMYLCQQSNVSAFQQAV